MRYWALAVLGLALAASDLHGQEPDLAHGAELLKPFKHQLQEALRRGLAEGPAEAIAACQLEAPEIVKTLTRDGVRLGRTSHRLRNPSNRSPEWVRPILALYLASDSDRMPRTVPLPDQRTGYAEPILVQPLCLTCHGEVQPPDIASRIKELYPEDQAVGFQDGDLRGVFWVEYPEARRVPGPHGSDADSQGELLQSLPTRRTPEAVKPTSRLGPWTDSGSPLRDSAS